MTSRRASAKAIKARFARVASHEVRLAPGDGCARSASTGATSPMVKVSPDQKLIDEALERKRRQESTVLGAG